MRWILLCLTLGLAQFGVALAQPMTTSQVDFDFDGTRLVGLLDVPTDRETQGLVIIVHGYGSTDVVRQNWYYDLRGNLALRGFASFVWDKPGNGLSEGTFDINQPVESSADEVLAAAAFLRSQNIPGADNIGLWGISRAGWIAPLALTQDPDLVFWISVSGVDGKESFGYLLRSNWAVLGYSAETMEALHAEWLAGTGITATGGSYTEYLDATRRYHADPFVQQFYGGAEDP
ncbi:MAG: CocE/NonD family hydrolase, partial [Pseudomonadota bacterium]